MTFGFEVEKTDPGSDARTGRLFTPHGVIPTPVFAPVGTLATVKALRPSDLHDLGVSLVLSNTYHLYLRPGDKLIEFLGGLHSFMAWDGPILTDSGGFQVFSLSKTRKIDDEGVTFQSHLDGSYHKLTPEKSIAIQENLGADIIMTFDECPPSSDYEYVKQSLSRTHAWAVRCLGAKTRDDQALFGIVQGGIFPDLRQQSAEFLTALDFPGYAIGGLAVGETKAEMYATLNATSPLLPMNKPRYLMGVGEPEDIVNAVLRGIDMFDCVMPTRIARNGAALITGGRINLRNAQYRHDEAPIQVDCTCYACTRFSRAYIRHLVKANEILAHVLLTSHNIHFMMELMRRIRKAIQSGNMQTFAREFLSHYEDVSLEAE
ncbi:MAG: tRNA guanosine(34) transglycosylase Tgt [Anaerolineae bacterium]